MEAKSHRVLSGQKDIASFLGVSVRTVQRYLSSIPVSRIGTKVMILESDLASWIQKNSTSIRVPKKDKATRQIDLSKNL